MRDRTAHAHGSLSVVKFAQWDFFLRAALKAHFKGAAALRRRYADGKITAKDFKAIRARQDAALDIRTEKLKREFYGK